MTKTILELKKQVESIETEKVSVANGRGNVAEIMLE